MMKNIIIVLLVIVLLSGCNKLQEASSSHIKAANLTEGEKEIIRLVGGNIDIFDYQLKEEYERLDIWLELYQNGEYKGNQIDFSSRLTESKGSIAIVKNDNNWKISHKSSVSVSSMTSELDENEEQKNYGKGMKKLNDAVTISLDQEIVLMVIAMNEDGSLSMYNLQHYVKNPEVVKEYDYIYLLKCAFSNKGMRED